jgi:hypothetical protein
MTRWNPSADELAALTKDWKAAGLPEPESKPQGRAGEWLWTAFLVVVLIGISLANAWAGWR